MKQFSALFFVFSFACAPQSVSGEPRLSPTSPVERTEEPTTKPEKAGETSKNASPSEPAAGEASSSPVVTPPAEDSKQEPEAGPTEAQGEEQTVDGDEPDPPGEQMALLIAKHIADSGDPGGAALPAPHNPQETNNYFSLVRSADDLATVLPTYALSDDGKKIAFVRGDDLSLWVASSKGTHAKKIFTAEKDAYIQWDGSESVLHTTGFFDLEFSPGGQRLYFQADLAATSLGLNVYDEKSGKTSLLTSANGYTVIKNCTGSPSLNGSLIAYRHSYSTLPAQATDLYFLLAPSGKELGIIGPEQLNVSRYIHSKCGIGKPVPPAKPQPVPAEMRKTNVCGDVAYRYIPLKFLDGSMWQIWYTVKKEKAWLPAAQLDMEDYGSLALGLEEAEVSLKSCQKEQSDSKRK